MMKDRLKMSVRRVSFLTAISFVVTFGLYAQKNIYLNYDGCQKYQEEFIAEIIIHDAHTSENNKIELSNEKGTIFNLTPTRSGDFLFTSFTDKISKEEQYTVNYLDDAGRHIHTQDFVISLAHQLEINKTDILCPGESDGIITFDLDDNQTKIKWKDQTITTNRDQLSAGIYEFDIIHKNGCIESKSIEIQGKDGIKIESNAIQLNCGNETYKSLNIDVTGGTAPYIVDWAYDGFNDNDDSMTLYDMQEKEYEVLVTDANNCKTNFIIQIDYKDLDEISTNPSTVFSDFKVNGMSHFNLMECTKIANGDIDNNGMDGSNYQIEFFRNEIDAERDINPLDYHFYNDGDINIVAKISSEDCYKMEEVQLRSSATFSFVLSAGESCDDGVPERLGGTYNYYVGTVLVTETIPSGGTWEIFRKQPNGSLVATNFMISCVSMSECYVDPYDNEGNYVVYYRVGGDLYIADYAVQALNPSVNIIETSICGNQPTLIAIANPRGGELIGEGIVTFTDVDLSRVYLINPAELSVGQEYYYEYTYDFILGTGRTCPQTARDTVGILEYPTAEITSAPSSSCSSSMVNLIGEGTVVGGTVELNWYDPDDNLVGTGTDIIVNNAVLSGDYILEVISSNGCIAYDTVNIEIFNLPELNCSTSLEVSCPNGNDATIVVQIDGVSDISTYQFDWESGESGPILNNVFAGDYIVTVTDPNGCTSSCNISVGQPELFAIECEINTEPVSCNGGSNGENLLTVTGATPPYQYSTDNVNFSSDNLLTGFDVGMHKVYVMDDNMCIDSCEFEITQLPTLECSSSITSEVSCFGGMNGSASSSASGGQGPYNYRWSNGDIGQILNNASVGNYTLTVSDQNDCTCTSTVAITELERLQITTIVSEEISCFAEEDGQINSMTSGGTMPYSYLWSDDSTEENLSNIGAGNYSLTVTDDNGCTASTSIVVTEPLEIELSIPNQSVCLDQEAAIPYSVFNTIGSYSLDFEILEDDGTNIDLNNFVSYNDDEIIFHSNYLLEGNVRIMATVSDQSSCSEDLEFFIELNSCFDLALKKTVSNLQSRYAPGDTVQFDIDIYNQGTVDAYDVLIEDYLTYPLNFDPSLNTNVQTGNENDWTLNNNQITTEVTHLHAGSQKKLKINLVIDPGFTGNDVYNSAEITFFKNVLRDLPVDEDDPESFDPTKEKDDDVDDDANGKMDNPLDDDHFDFASLKLCGENEFACNNYVNISVNHDCEAQIVATMFIDGSIEADLFNVILEDLNGNPIANPIGFETLGDTIVAIAEDRCSDKTCWSYLIIEDKLPVKLTCNPPLYVFCTEDEVDLDLVLAQGIDNCYDSENIILSDLIEKCTEPGISQLRKIKYFAIDEKAYHSDTCEQLIYYRSIDVNLIDIPKDTIYYCEKGNSAWDINGNDYPDLIEAGVPNYQDTKLIDSDLNSLTQCHINISYQDNLLENCGNTFTIVRNWILIDWCNALTVEDNQIIKLKDTTGPSLFCPNSIDLSVDENRCLADLKVQPIGDDISSLISLDDCNNEANYQIEVIFLRASELNAQMEWNQATDLGQGQYNIFDLEFGTNWVRYLVVDECGNESDCTWEINVIDDKNPDVICDHYTKVSLDKDGIAYMVAESIDDLSHDDCSSVRFGIRRFGQNCNDQDFNGDLVFSTNGINYYSHAGFCCEDLNQDYHTVELIVIDESGNYETCQSLVSVENKNPDILQCTNKERIILSCDADYDLYFEEPTGYISTCGELRIISEDDITDLDCHEKNITRTWQLVNSDDEILSTCQQTIWLRNPEIDITDLISFPEDKIISCNTEGYDPDKNDEVGNIQLPNMSCSNLQSYYEDVTFSNVEGACIKILRKWTVYDWCIYDPNDPNTTGFYSKEQVIKVVNTTLPTLKCEDKTYEIKTTNCSYSINETIEVEFQNCVDNKNAKYSYSIDLFGNNSIDHIGNTNSISIDLEPGVHIITWEVSDDCGNFNSCSQTIEIIDAKAPTPYCYNSLSVLQINHTGIAEIWAKDFDLGSTDNCTDEIYYTFNRVMPLYLDQKHYFKKSANNTHAIPADLNDYLEGNAECWDPDKKSSSKAFLCHNLGLRQIKMYVYDQYGNKDFCAISLELRDENGYCDSDTIITSRINGNVSSSKGPAMPFTELALMNEQYSILQSKLSDNDGMYLFEDIPMDQPMKLSAHYEDEYLNGISTLDLVIIQNHILGKKPIDSNYNLLAADVNDDKKVNAIDLLELRKLILGIYEEYPNSNSWRFVETTQENELSAFNMISEINISPSDTTHDYNFTGVKIGDVNGSHILLFEDDESSTRSDHPKYIDIIDRSFQKEETVIIDLSLANDNILNGLQFSIQYDNEYLVFNGLKENDQSPILNENIFDNGKRINISYNDQIEKDLTISLVFTAIDNGKLSSSISLNSDRIKAEYYDMGNDIYPLLLRVVNEREINPKQDDFKLMQNNPNPFSNYTSIEYELFKAGHIDLQIYNATGKVIYYYTAQKETGKHIIQIDKSQLGNEAGLLFYKLTLDSKSQIKKMILSR